MSGETKKQAVLPVVIGFVATGTLLAFSGLPDEPFCEEVVYDVEGRRWEDLGPAEVEQSSDDCIGYCFNALVNREEADGLARVFVIESETTFTRGLVERTAVYDNSDVEVGEGLPVRFACMNAGIDQSLTPRFESCAQMRMFEPSNRGCEDDREMVSDAGELGRATGAPAFLGVW